jgi:DNA-binding transcriptional LysR family regulator
MQADMTRRPPVVLADWNDARILLGAARAPSFMKASEQIGISQATISRRIGALEARLGFALFRRTPMGSELTEMGRSVLAAAEAMEAAAARFDRTRADWDPMAGVVRIAAGEGILTYVLMGDLASFQQQHPLMAYRLLTSADPNESSAQADLSIVAMAPGIEAQNHAGDLRMAHLGRMTFVAHASQRYLDDFGRPVRGDDLAGHRLIDLASYSRDHGLAPWNRIISARAQRGGAAAVSVVDTSTALHSAIRAGLGIGLLPIYATAIDPELRPLPLGFGQLAIDLWLVAHGLALHNNPRTTFIFGAVQQIFARRTAWFPVRDFASDRDALGWFADHGSSRSP